MAPHEMPPDQQTTPRRTQRPAAPSKARWPSEGAAGSSSSFSFDNLRNEPPTPRVNLTGPQTPSSTASSSMLSSFLGPRSSQAAQPISASAANARFSETPGGIFDRRSGPRSPSLFGGETSTSSADGCVSGRNTSGQSTAPQQPKAAQVCDSRVNTAGGSSTSADQHTRSFSYASRNPVLPMPSLSKQLSSLNLGNEGLAQGVVTSVASASVTPPPNEPPWSLSDEQPPDHEFFDPKVQQALGIAEEMVRDLERATRKTSADYPADDQVKALLTKMALREGWKLTRTRKVAVLGSSGEGKSSLINSLLHVPGIAHTSDIGSACTSVVTEYHQKKTSQQSPITIEVEYLSEDGIEELVKELAWSYRQLYLPNAQSADLTSDQDYAKYQRESEQAWSALEAAFQHHSGFSAEFLRDVSEGAEDRIDQQLFEWARGIDWPSGQRTGDGRYWLSTAETSEECCAKTKIFMQDGLWPFTKIIRVYLDTQVLDGGVILADLAGLQDTNLARVKATQDYLSCCDNILVVAKISRAITDQSVKSALFSAVAQHAPMEWEQSGGRKMNLAVVCTETERINIKKATEEFCGLGKTISPEEMRQLEIDIQAAKATGDHKKKKAAKRRLEFVLIAARNAHVKEGLQRRYASDTGGHLDVFCVGNEAYQKFSRKGNAEGVKASGIPDLRRFCYTITADARLLEARHLLQALLPGVLHSVELWADSHLIHGAFSEEDRINMIRHLDNIREETHDYVATMKEDLIECYREQLMEFWRSLEEGCCPGIFRVESVALEYETARLNRDVIADSNLTDTYDAWCRKNGNHETRSREHVDWNGQIIWKMRMELEFQWDVVQDEIPRLFSVLEKDVSRELIDLKEATIMEAADTPHRDLLMRSIDSVDQQWKYSMSLERKKFSKGFQRIRTRATESNATSYVVREMLPSYRSACTHRGTGMSAPQKAIVGGHMEGDQLFPGIAIRMSGDMEALVRETEESVNGVTKRLLDRVQADMAMALRQGVLVDGGDNSVTELKGVVGELRRKLAGVSDI